MVTGPGVRSGNQWKSRDGNSAMWVPEKAGENTIRTTISGSVPYTVQRTPRALKPGRNSAYSRTGGSTAAAAANESESST